MSSLQVHIERDIRARAEREFERQVDNALDPQEQEEDQP